MLDPQNRTLLRDALRPPSGYSLDRAIVTTFSLDLMALLTIPVSFTFFGWKDHDGPPTVDPLALLESLRRYANKVTVFCQAGQIHVPRHVQLLLGYLEDRASRLQTGPEQIRVSAPGGEFVQLSETLVVLNCLHGCCHILWHRPETHFQHVQNQCVHPLGQQFLNQG